MRTWPTIEQSRIVLYLLKWTVLGSIVGVLSGSASALFLWSLERVTESRVANPWLLYLLPVAGLCLGWLYYRFGALAGRGNNLILDQLHGADHHIPFRMAPMVLIGTVVTHLFGGSAGREGTAVQMGGSLADTFGRLVRLSNDDRRLLVMSGIAGGFGAVFGTPIAGALFGVEVVRAGSVRHAGLFPCLVAALVGQSVTHWWGIDHAHYLIDVVPGLSPVLLIKVAAAGVAFGLAALLFTESVHRMRALFSRLIPAQALRPAVGGLLVIGLTVLFQTRAYLGLSLPLIPTAFTGMADSFAFLWKTLFTAVTLGSGFQGGEVTPLFVIGATLGSTLSHLLALPPGLLAGLGLVAVFAGAANTPIACIVMGVELFGHGALPYFAIACIIAYAISGQRSIYSSQNLAAKGAWHER